MTPEVYKRPSVLSAFVDPFRFFDDFFAPTGFREGRGPDFRTDITDEGDHYLMEADLPGFRREDIHLELTGNTLTLRAERRLRHSDEEKERTYIRSERSYGVYTRVYDVSGIAQDKIKSKYEDGVLSVTLPKQEPDSPKRVQLSIE